IQCNNFYMREVQIWEYVLKWGLAQNPELPSDHKSFSKDDFKTLKKTLQQCIPFIRFTNLTAKEFMEKVMPYRKILPKELYEDSLNTFMGLLDPNSKPTDRSKDRITKGINKKTVNSPHKIEKVNIKAIDSKIITYQHVDLI